MTSQITRELADGLIAQVRGDRIQRVQDLRTELATLEAEIDVISAFERMVDRMDSDVLADPPEKDTYRNEITTVIHQVLTGESPMHRADILERVQERGIYVGGLRPLDNLSTYLSKDCRFHATGRGYWTLELPGPEVVPIAAAERHRATGESAVDTVVEERTAA